MKHSNKTEIRENHNGDLCNIIRATYGVIKCPLPGCPTTDCSKGLPPHSYQLLDVIGQEVYKKRLALFYNIQRLIKEELNQRSELLVKSEKKICGGGEKENRHEEEEKRRIIKKWVSYQRT